MTQRPDISNKLIHFTRGKTYDDAFCNLWNIMNNRTIFGGNNMIKGEYTCVCFTEAPLPIICNSYSGELNFQRYSPFGIVFEKEWIFSKGGLPVIYEPDSCYEKLPEDFRWRHVRYELNTRNPIDFTWERDWRIKCDELTFSPQDVAIIVPERMWVDYLLDMHKNEQIFKIELYSNLLGRDLAESMSEEFTWEIVILT